VKMCADLSRTQRNLLVCERSSFLDEKNRVSSQVEQLRFNYKVSVLLPECGSAPSHLESILNSFSSFYLIKKLPLYELLDKDFLQSAVYQACTVCVCVCVCSGHLVFSLDKDTFETLGLEGRPSRSNRTSSRYGISYGSDSGLLQALTSRLKLQMDFLISHHPAAWSTPPCGRVTPTTSWSGSAPWTPPSAGEPRYRSRALRGHDRESLFFCVYSENSSSDFLSTLTCLEPEATVSRAVSVSACGLLLPQDLQHLVEELRCHLQQAQTNSWASVTVHGFTDSPVSWDDDERDVLTGGHDLYNLLMFPDHTYRLHLAAGAQNTCPP
uniref:Ribonuclease P/MRP 40 subunit n=1 Tax=Xiphophorus maculatus TaxID=8083 RepID=A0A3B5PTM6_XIPMA